MRTHGLTLISALAWTLWLAGPLPAQPTSVTPGLYAQVEAADRLALGPLKLGMSEDQVEQAIGAPTTRFEAQIDEVSGQRTHATNYACGATLAFLDNPEVATPGTLVAIILDEACHWQGVGGLKLGISPSQARGILADLMDSGAAPFESEGEASAGVLFPDSGTVLLVRFYQEKVSYIYLGPDLR